MNLQNTTFFSIIIPTYNRAAMLRRCLDSLCHQTYTNFEVLVCDDGSTDDSSIVVEAFNNLLDIKYLWEENWGGPARPRNRGISTAAGNWICFLDSDDWYYPNKLEEIVKHVQNYDIIYHDLDMYRANNKKYRKMKGRQLKGDIFKNLLLNGSIPNSSVCIKTELLRKINGFCEDKELIAVEDSDCFLRLSEITSKFKYLPQSLGAYYVGENISFCEKQHERMEALLARHIHKLSKQDQAFAYKTLTYGKAQIFHRLSMFQEARALYIKSMSKYSFSRNIKVIGRYLLTLIKVVW